MKTYIIATIAIVLCVAIIGAKAQWYDDDDDDYSYGGYGGYGGYYGGNYAGGRSRTVVVPYAVPVQQPAAVPFGGIGGLGGFGGVNSLTGYDHEDEGILGGNGCKC